ncbi:MAG: cupin domain-containing protein [Actinomycetota bacterium]|nr:cupin domain-containing protein [Actinomycetota bacterium]
MALLSVPDEGTTHKDFEDVKEYLAGIDIEYDHWEPAGELSPTASEEEVLAAYADQVEELKASGDYTTADVIDLTPDTPNLDDMLAKFNIEHWHDEDEVRFIVEGRGLFHVRPADGPVISITVEPGDLMRVPRGTWHWFDLCGEKRIRAIRLFQNKSGWTPNYTGSGADQGYQPVCLGPTHIPLGREV